jgi:hypothetical protein
MRRLLLCALATLALVLGATSSAATKPGAIVTAKSGKTYVFSGARCFAGRLNFGERPLNKPSGARGFSIQLDPFRPGRVGVGDGFIKVPSVGLHVALSGTALVNSDGKSGTFNVWGRWTAGPTGHRFTGTWRCR